jgi:SAM-dependent methyltransferase
LARQERAQWSIVDAALADPDTRRAFESGERLPRHYAAEWPERAVEYPWALVRLGTAQDVLDAGATFNHAAILPRLSDRRLTITTLAPEARHYPERGVSYVFADLRELPFRNDAFDLALCISVLEHVGMDNRVYGHTAAPSGSPRAESRRAVSELARVIRPGGRALLSVPYGQRMNMGWQRQFNREDLEDVLNAVGQTASRLTVYRRDNANGWQVSSLEAAAQGSYGDGAHAICCVELTF